MDGLKECFSLFLNMPSSLIKHSLYGPANVVHDFLVFNVDSWPAIDSALINLRDSKIERLVHWFDPALKAARCQVQNVLPQWHSLKITVNSQFRDRDCCSLWRMLLSQRHSSSCRDPPCPANISCWLQTNDLCPEQD